MSGSRELVRVERAAARAAAARAELEAAMRDASAAGYALRPIAAAAGLSVEWTRRLVTSGSTASQPGKTAPGRNERGSTVENRAGKTRRAARAAGATARATAA